MRLGILGMDKEARAMREELIARHRNGTADAYNVAEAYSGTADRAATMRWLRTMVEDRSSWVYHLRLPFWKEYRSDPEFKAILQQMGLPD